MAAGPDRTDAWSGVGAGWAVTATLLAGILAWGGLGYLLDRLIGASRIFTAIGIVIGAGGGIYLVYLRYGRVDDSKK